MSVEVIERDGQRLVIDYDTDPMNPREWDNTGVMVCFHRNYNLGDKTNYREQDYEGWAELREQLEADGATHIHPLYLLDHSGLSMRMGTGFSDPWDSGQVGFIYVTPESLAYVGCDPNSSDIDRILASEVATYDSYLRGEVYGYRVERDSKCECCGHTDTQVIDSCWGFYSIDEVLENAGWEREVA